LREDRGHGSLEIVRELFGLHEQDSAREAPASELAEVHDLPVHRRRER